MAELYLPDGSNWINALEAGQKAGMTDRKMKAASSAAGLMTSGDYKGAAGALYSAGDFTNGSAVADAGYKQTEQSMKLSRQAAVKDKLAAGDFSGAYTAAEGDKDLTEGLDKVWAHAKDTTNLLASGLQSLKGEDGHWMPYDQAKARLAEIGPGLVQRGLDAKMVQGFDPTPANLETLQKQALGLKDDLDRHKPMVVGQKLVDPVTGKKIYEGTEWKSVGQGDKLVPITGGNPGLGDGAAPTGTPAGTSVPRGLRNNNPLNVTVLPSGHAWDGQTGADGQYATFSSPEAGWSAADRNLQTYATNHGINTIAGVVNRWAPTSGGNDPATYAATVAQAVGVAPDAPLDLADPGVRRKVLEAMAGVENGRQVAFGQGGAAHAAAPTQAASGDPAGTIYGAPKAPKEMARPATAEEKAQYGIPADVPAQVRPDGSINVISGVGARAKPPPAAITSGYTSNKAALQQIDQAIAAIKANPHALGMKNYAPDAINQRIDPHGVDTRAAIANIGSKVLHDRSGAAVTAAESPRLMPFIPQATDTPEAAIKKLQGLKQQYVNANTEMEVAFGADQGYAPLGQPASAPHQAAPSAPHAPAAGPSLKHDPQALNEARSAIQKGAAREKVIERLRQHGIDPAGL